MFSRFTEMALSMLKILDLKFLYPLAEGTFALLKHCATLRGRIVHKHGKSHQNVNESVCPIITLTKGFEVRSTGGAGEIRKRIIKVFNHWAETCKCCSHFHLRISLALAGLTPASDLAFIQPFVETVSGLRFLRFGVSVDFSGDSANLDANTSRPIAAASDDLVITVTSSGTRVNSRA